MTTTQMFTILGVVSAEIAVVMGFMMHGFNSLNSRLIVIEADLRRFYHDLGRHEADIATLKQK
jgi:hypothetical protein